MEKDKITTLFTKELAEIKNSSLHNLIIECYSTLDDSFFNMPSSSTGKYHPEVCNRMHGLIIHIKLVFEYAKVLIDATFKYYEINERQRLSDMILTAILLHDISKKKHYKKYTDYKNHPILSSNIVKDVMAKQENTLFDISFAMKNTILVLIENHMGIYTPKEYEKGIESYTIAELIVYYSDILASQKNQNHLPYIEEMYRNVCEILA